MTRLAAALRTRRAPRWAAAGLVALVAGAGLGVAPTGTGAAAGQSTPSAPVAAAAAPSGRVVVRTVPEAVVPGGVSVGSDTWVVDGGDDPAAEARRRAASPGVAWAEPDASVSAAARPDDPLLAQQAYLDQIGAPAAWAATTGSADVVVAVLDTRVDAGHPDLDGKLVAGGDFVTVTCGAGGASAAHGTVVAGLIGAATDNGQGVVGLGWQVRVMPLRVLCDNGVGSVVDVASAVRHAVDHGADVINLSLTGVTDTRVVSEAVGYAQAAGVVVVAAAGNSASTVPVYPASLPGVLAVGAGLGDGLASFTNRGPWVDLVAPGVGLYSTVPGGGYTGGWSGTSFSAPLVAATVALLRSRFPDIGLAGVEDRLARSARRIAGTGTTTVWGALDTGRAVAGPFSGFWVAGADGSVQALGDAADLGQLVGRPLAAPVVAAAGTPAGRGFWLTSADGGVFTFGDAGFFGSTGGLVLNEPVVAVASTPSGRGYWLVARDGGVFAFGDAGFFGSTGGLVLNEPVVAVASTPSGRGYWLVARDGGVFAFGDAGFLGSTGGLVLNEPVVAVAATVSGRGYRMLAGDGGVFAFGDADFSGSAAPGAPVALVRPAVALVPAPEGSGYWVVGADGGSVAYGDAPALLGRPVPTVARAVAWVAPWPAP